MGSESFEEIYSSSPVLKCLNSSAHGWGGRGGEGEGDEFTDKVEDAVTRGCGEIEFERLTYKFRRLAWKTWPKGSVTASQTSNSKDWCHLANNGVGSCPKRIQIYFRVFLFSGWHVYLNVITNWKVGLVSRPVDKVREDIFVVLWYLIGTLPRVLERFSNIFSRRGCHGVNQWRRPFNPDTHMAGRPFLISTLKVVPGWRCV